MNPQRTFYERQTRETPYFGGGRHPDRGDGASPSFTISTYLLIRKSLGGLEDILKQPRRLLTSGLNGALHWTAFHDAQHYLFGNRAFSGHRLYLLTCRRSVAGGARVLTYCS